MVIFAIAALLGDLILQSFSILPAKAMVAIGCMVVVMLIIIIRQRDMRILLAGLLVGFFWSYVYALHILHFNLPRDLENKTVTISGYIKSIPRKNLYGSSFEFHLAQLDSQNVRFYPDIDLILSVSLSRHDSNIVMPKLLVGEQWQFKAKLKRIHGLQSLGAFDYERWAFSKGWRYQGRVLDQTAMHVAQRVWYRYPVTQLREFVKFRLQQYSMDHNVSPWLLALMIGEREMIYASDWDVLRKTGTNHLMAIAGLHVGMLTHFLRHITLFLWRQSTVLLSLMPASEASLYAGLIGGMSYAMLSGFLVPTQRAAMMLIVSVFMVLQRHRWSSWYPWSFALLFVLLLNPLSVLMDSFWLSFITIALIIYGMSGRLSGEGFWWKWGRVQWVIAVGLIPITLLWYQECSLSSLITNMITIPWLELIILPVVFISEVLLTIDLRLAQPLLQFVDLQLSWLWGFLRIMANLPWTSIHFAIPNHELMIMMMVGFLLLLLPSGIPGRWLGFVWAAPVFFQTTSLLQHGDFNISVLDVGQGLSVVVQTKHHTLLFDTGPGIDQGFNAGRELVMPFVYANKISGFDAVFVSHGDNDHAGGLSAVVRESHVKRIFSSETKLKNVKPVELCVAGQAWQWDGVDFKVLYPAMETFGLGNDSSCVLVIGNQYQRVILPGDIEKFAENILLRDNANQLRGSILIAPHHGSKTSSTPAFINAVRPRYVIYSTGYLNRYHLPHPTIVDRYQQMKVIVLNTVDTGTIIFRITDQAVLQAPSLYRYEHRRYWQDFIIND